MSNNNPAKGTKDNKYEIVMKMFDSRNELLDSDKEETKPIDEVTKKWDMNDKIINLFSKNISKDQELKEKYAEILIKILIFQLVALNVLFILKGFNIIRLSDSTLNLYITGGIAEVFLLVRVIVKYLFKDNLTDSLNIILENNNKFRKYKNSKDKNNKKEI